MQNENIIGCAFLVGIVTESKIGYSKVKFPDLDDMTSQWLAINYAFTLGKREAYALAVGTQVNCLMDANLEEGTILGARYSEADTPPTSNNATYLMAFDDGSQLEFDGSGQAIIKAENIKLDGDTTCTGNMTVQKKLTYQGGMSGSGGGGGATATIDGNVRVNGNVNASGSIDENR